jgi:hypothetical protein
VEPLDGGAPPVRATLAERAGGDPAPGWVVLHGVTVRGRSHPALERFVRALASTGGRVLVPEIPEWTRLEFAPEAAQAVIRGAVDRLAGDPGTAAGGVGLIGFSFGAPQALLTAADPGHSTRIRSVVGWGGYADLRRTLDFHFSGEHRWGERTYRTRPDPYGRWVVGANCLTLVPGLANTKPVARALRALAVAAGEDGAPAWTPRYDSLKAHLRRDLPRRFRPLYDLFVPPPGRSPDPLAVRELLDALVPAARREAPLLDPIRMIEGVRVPVRLLHSRSDHLIPFTETLALQRSLERRAPDLEVHLTGLFEHSGTSSGGTAFQRIRGMVELGRALAGIFSAGRASDAGRPSAFE